MREQVEDRRDDVDQCDIAPHALAGTRGAGELHDQRHLDLLAVEQQAVLVLAVVAQTLAVVGEQDDERALVEPAAIELGEEIADQRVGGGDLAVVGVGVARAPGFGWAVGRVRLVEMEQEEERPAAGLGEKSRSPRRPPRRPAVRRCARRRRRRQPASAHRRNRSRRRCRCGGRALRSRSPRRSRNRAPAAAAAGGGCAPGRR